MSRKQKRNQHQNDEDEMAFLVKVAAANQAKKVQIESESKIPDSFFSALAPIPSELPSPTILKYKKIYSEFLPDQERDFKI
jgi:hypothetical protein